MLWIVVEVHFVLPVGVVSTQHRLLKRSLSSVGLLVHLRQQPGAHVCVVLLLGPRGRPGAVCLSPPGSTQSRLLKSESEISDSSPFTLLKIVLAVLVPLPFLIRFRMHLSVSTKKSHLGCYRSFIQPAGQFWEKRPLYPAVFRPPSGAGSAPMQTGVFRQRL